MEMNPEHPVTQQMREQWHKVVGLLMLHAGIKEFEITPEIIAKLGNCEYAVIMDNRAGRATVRMLKAEEAEAFMRGANSN